MVAISSKRFGMPSAGPRVASSAAPSTSNTTHINSLYAQSRLRPITHRVQSSETSSGIDKGIRTSLDTMGGSSVDSFIDQTKSQTSQRIRPVRSFTSPMQFESKSVVFPASSSPSKESFQESSNVSEGSEGVEGTEEYVIALHDFSSTNETCLSFESGQVIKVFNRDESGWWDGELNGQRGWFPSNYVDEDGLTSTVDLHSSEEYSSPRGSIDQADSETDDHTKWVSGAAPRPVKGRAHNDSINTSSNSSQETYTKYHPSRSPTPTANTHLHSNQRSWSTSSSSSSTILDPIHHAITLLHNAVRANRVAHFQPSTACVISSVRSVLSATDCLTRESSVLKAHPILAKERKQILAELSRLVTQARVASAPNVEDSRREWEMEEMLNLADIVLRNVRRFLEVAIECGVAVPDRRSSVYDDLYEDRRYVRQQRSLIGASPLDRNEQDKTPTPESPRDSAYYSSAGAKSPKSFLELHNTDSISTQVTKESSQAAAAAAQQERTRSDSLRSETQDSSSCDHSQADSGSGSGSASGFGSGTSQSGSCDSLVGNMAEVNHSSSPHYTMVEKDDKLEYSPSDVLQRLQLANDHLLSIIAAFIGHIHSHTRSSHASSYAFLIDMTRATVDGIRNLLLVVESVDRNGQLQQQFPRQMSILGETKEGVYETTTALVTAARIITGSSNSINGASPTTTTSSSLFANEEDEKTKLLQTATAVLRTGGECVGAARLCLNRADPKMRISIIPLGSLHAGQEEREGGGSSLEQTIHQEQDDNRPTSGLKRGKHTLSLLGRKATSLSCLREQYEQQDDDDDDDDSSRDVNGFSTIDEGYDEEESRQASSTAETTETMESLAADGEDTSDSSEPMSRDHSRTSGSTLHSTQSLSTANTSARPSMDRSGDFSNVIADTRLPTPPHSAPLHGSFASSSSSTRQSSSSQGTPLVRNRSASLVVTSHDTYLPSTYDLQQQADVCFNSEGQLTGATLSVLVERMTPHDTTIDATFATTFFLCFRLFTTPIELFDALESRYNMRPPKEIEVDAEQFTKWVEQRVAPIRLRIFNFFKSWLETHWNAATDYDILDRLIHFTRTTMAHSLNRPGQRLTELAIRRQMSGRIPKAAATNYSSAAPSTTTTMMATAGSSNSSRPASLKRMMSTERIRLGATPNLDVNTMYSSTTSSKGGVAAPTPIISKSLLSTLKSTTIPVSKINIVDFDPLELARQFTIMESKIYCSILPEELLGQEFSKKVGISNAINVKTMSALSTHITGWISECILGEEDARKRTSLIKFFIKLGDRCLTLNNFNTLMAIQCALNSSTIARLKRTWDGLPTKHRHMMEFQRRSVEHTRNFAGYRQTLRQTVAPALPFVGLFLTDLTFCHEGNASTRPSPLDPSKKLLNFDKYVKMSRIIGDLQRFQLPYNLLEVPEIQNYLELTLNDVQRGKGAGTADDLYRRSLLLEPRSNNASSSEPSGPATITARGGSDIKLGLDLFNWK